LPTERAALASHLRSRAWRAALRDAFASESFRALEAFLESEAEAGVRVLPAREQVFAAFDLVEPDAVRVVILGQDPYPTPGHAHGLAFSHAGDGALPRSLRNILREVERDLGLDLSGARGDLTPWARQGVLLLNAVLTVRAGEAGSHRRRGWEALTDAALAALAARPEPIAFLLWGGEARKKTRLLGPPHLVLEAGHPSPLSVRHFRGCGHFGAANRYLGDRAVDWRLEPNAASPGT
jgi:uracil-DNA glycosylase